MLRPPEPEAVLDLLNGGSLRIVSGGCLRFIPTVHNPRGLACPSHRHRPYPCAPGGRAAPRPARGCPRPRPVRAADGDPRHDHRQRRAAEHRAGPALLGHQPVLGAQRLRPRRSAACSCSAAGRATSSAGAGSSSPASPCSRWRRWPAAWPPQPGLLIAARALQGVGGAIASPAALALVVSALPGGRRAEPGDGPVRRHRQRRRLARPGARRASSPSGSRGAGRFFINVPVGIAVAACTPFLLTETPRRPGHFDLAGALTSVTGMAALVYALHPGRQRRLVGPDDAGRAGPGGGRGWPRSSSPRPVPRSRSRRCGCSPTASARRPMPPGCCWWRGMFGMFFFATQYLQADPGLQPGAGRPGVPAHDGPALRRVPAGRPAARAVRAGPAGGGRDGPGDRGHGLAVADLAGYRVPARRAGPDDACSAWGWGWRWCR